MAKKIKQHCWRLPPELDTDGQSIASQSAGAGQSPGCGRISKVAPKVCLWLPLVGDHEQEGGRGSLPPFDKLMIIRSRRREIKL